MDSQVDRLVDKIWTKFQSTPPDARLMIAISGIPGSGKSSLARTMTDRMNELYNANASPPSTGPTPGPKNIAITIPMDGYHLTRHQLSLFPDPANAFARRGAPFTFDGLKFLALVTALRAPLTSTSSSTSTSTSTSTPGTDTQPQCQSQNSTSNSSSTSIYAPSFDHALKDPIENDIEIAPSARILFFEGNYLSLNQEPWSRAAALMDENWFVDVDVEVARQRLVRRHLEAGIVASEREASERVEGNDLVNGGVIVRERLVVQEVVRGDA